MNIQLFISTYFLFISTIVSGLTTCPKQCICHEQSIACSCDGTESNDLIISSLGKTYISSLVVHTCQKVTVLNGSFSGVVLIDRLSFIGIGNLYFEPHAFKDILQSPKLVVIDESNIKRISALSFAGLSHVDHLWFRNSRIGVIGTEAFHYLTNIDYIYFHKTSIERIETRAFSKMYKISHVYFKQQVSIDFIASQAFSESQIDEVIFDNLTIDTADNGYLANVDTQSILINDASIHQVPIEHQLELEIQAESCRFVNCHLNELFPINFGCDFLQIEHSTIDRIGSSNKETGNLQSFRAYNCTINRIDEFSFINHNINEIILNESRIDTIASEAFKDLSIGKMIWHSSSVSKLSERFSLNSTIRQFQMSSVFIEEMRSSMIQKSKIKELSIVNSTVITLHANLLTSSFINKCIIDNSKMYNLSQYAFNNPTQLQSISITNSDISSSSINSTSSILSATSQTHPIQLTVSNNTLDCAPSLCSVNSFLLDFPAHSPLNWQLKNNKCRQGSICHSSNDRQFPSLSISCKFTWLIAECVCTSPEAYLPLDSLRFNTSLLIIGDCDRLKLDSSIVSTISQLYIFRVSHLEIYRLPPTLKTLKIFHSTIFMNQQHSNPTRRFFHEWHISHSFIASFSDNSLSNAQINIFALNHSRIVSPSHSTNHLSINQLIVNSSLLESTQLLFQVSRSLIMSHSMVFSSIGGLGMVESAQLQNNTLLDCCGIATIECFNYFHGARCDRNDPFIIQRLVQTTSSYSHFNLFFSWILLLFLFL